MQAPTSTDFTCLPPEIITAIALTSGQVWRSLARVNHMCSGTLSWKEFVQRFSSVGVVTQFTLGPGAKTKYNVDQPERTRITLLDGVPHSEDGVDTWSIEVRTKFSTCMGPINGVHGGLTTYKMGGVYRRGKRVSSYPEPTMIHVIAWELPS